LAKPIETLPLKPATTPAIPGRNVHVEIIPKPVMLVPAASGAGGIEAADRSQQGGLIARLAPQQDASGERRHEKTTESV
jgi:hypothetical protein